MKKIFFQLHDEKFADAACFTLRQWTLNTHTNWIQCKLNYECCSTKMKDVQWLCLSHKQPLYWISLLFSSFAHLKSIWIEIEIFSIAQRRADSFASSHLIWWIDGWMCMLDQIISSFIIHNTYIKNINKINWWISDCYKIGKHNIFSNHRLALI